MASLVRLTGTRDPLDLTRYIPMGKYKVNDIDYYDEWEDSNYRRHKRLKTTKAEGSFTLVFPSVNAYVEFVNEIDLLTDRYGSIACEVWCNNKHKLKSIRAFIEFEPQNDLPLLADKKSDGFEVTITERG